MIVMTFDAHEEPVIATREQYLRALLEVRVDFVVAENATKMLRDV